MFGFNELSTPIKAVIALAIVLLLVLLAGLLLRRIAGGRLKLPGQGSRTRQPRLGIVDIFEMDRQRQLVLLRRDNVEHLVMIGGPNDLVIEASIVRSASRAQVPVVGEAVDKSVPPLTAESRAEVPAEPAPASRPNFAAAPPAESVRAAPEPPPKPPVATPTSALGGIVAGAATLAAATTTANPAPSTAAMPAPPKTAPPQTAPPQPAEPLASVPPASVPLAPVSVAPVPVANPVPPPPPPSSSAIDDQIAASFEAELAKMAPPPVKPILEPIAPSPLAKASAGELEDMTRQLQEALKRPFSGVKSAPPATEIVVPTISAAIVGPAVTPEAPKLVVGVPVVKLADSSPAAYPVLGPTQPPALVPAPREVALSTPKPDFSFDLERELASALKPVPAPDIMPRAEKPAEPKEKAMPALAAERQDRAASLPPAQTDTAETAANRLEPTKPAIKTAPPGRDDAGEPAKPPAPEPAKEPAKLAPKAVKSEAVNEETAKSDPLSVDAIEAEFARLLNRGAPPKS
ncbi:MAG: hypothetical protein ACRCUE_11995 [Bosea sp. (in: a-proteobacteria)]